MSIRPARRASAAQCRWCARARNDGVRRAHRRRLQFTKCRSSDRPQMHLRRFRTGGKKPRSSSSRSRDAKKVDDFAVLTCSSKCRQPPTPSRWMPRVDAVEATGVGWIEERCVCGVRKISRRRARAGRCGRSDSSRKPGSSCACLSSYVILNIFERTHHYLYSLFGDTTRIETLDGCPGNGDDCRRLRARRSPHSTRRRWSNPTAVAS